MGVFSFIFVPLHHEKEKDLYSILFVTCNYLHDGVQRRKCDRSVRTNRHFAGSRPSGFGTHYIRKHPNGGYS